jgi:hypothetical protein
MHNVLKHNVLRPIVPLLLRTLEIQNRLMPSELSASASVRKLYLCHMESKSSTPTRTHGQSRTYTPRAYPNKPPSKMFLLTGDVAEANFDRYNDDLTLFKRNLKFVVNKRGYTITQVYKELNRHGVRVSRESMLEKGRVRKMVSLLYMSTFARVLDVPTWVLFSDDIEAVWDAIG